MDATLYPILETFGVMNTVLNAVEEIKTGTESERKNAIKILDDINREIYLLNAELQSVRYILITKPLFHGK